MLLNIGLQKLYREMTMIKPGDKYGMLTIIKVVKPLKGKNRRYLCSCDCGGVSLVWTSGLVNKKEPTKSCGCLQLKSAMREPGRASLSMLFARLIKNANIRGLPVNITREQHEDIISKNCNFCGRAPSPYNVYIRKDGTMHPSRKIRSASRAWVKVNGVDRLDSLKGYDMDNCVPCCAVCNYMKLDYTVEEFIDQAYAIVAHQESLKKRIA